MKRLITIIPLLLLVFCSCTPHGVTEPEFDVVFADVGKADFILIRVKDKFGVIDAGYKDSTDKIDEVMDAYGVSRLEFAVATHNDKDHIGGMAHVIEKYSPGTLYITPLEGDGKQYGKMLDAAALTGADVVKLKKGGKFELNEAVFDVLSPDAGLLELNDQNEASVVLKMTYGKKSVLFMGDAQLKAEQMLTEKSKNALVCDVIKIGHHGSEKSSSQVFLSKTNAKYAVISTGDERPASEITLKAIDACKMQLLNTHTDGDVVISGTKDTITYKTNKNTGDAK